MKNLTQGVYGDMPAEDYHADPAIEPSLSRGTIRDLLDKTPAHVFNGNKRLNPKAVEPENKSAFDLGTAAHALLLEGEDVIEIVIANDWKTKVAKQAKEDAYAAGKIPMLPPQYEKVHAMVEAATNQIAGCKELGVKNLRKEGKAEQTYIWEKDGTWYRARTDWIANDDKLIIDYKTEGQLAAPESFAKKAINFGYDIQSALYPKGVEAVKGIKPKMIFVVQETTAPYLCSFIGLPPAFVEMGEQKIDMGTFLWKECLASGKWPGYPNRVCWPDVPGYALAQWDEKASNVGI